MAFKLEHRVIKSKFQELVQGIKHSVSQVSDKCLESELITDETHAKLLQLNYTEEKQARILLTNVSTTIHTKHGSFERFATILKEATSTEHLGICLNSELKNFKDRAKITQEGSSSRSTSPIEETLEHEPRDKAYDLTDNMTVTSIEEETRHQLKTPAHKSGTIERYDNSMRELKNAMENLEYAKFDTLQRESKIKVLKKEMKDVKEENCKLKEESKNYHETLDELQNLLRENQYTLENKTQQLECKLSETEKQKYRETQKREEAEEQVRFLKLLKSELSNKKSELSNEMIRLILDKRELQQDLEEVNKLLLEADRRSRECDALEAQYEEVCEQLQEVKAEVKKEQDTSQHMYTEFQEERKRFMKYSCFAFCIIITVVIILALVTVIFAYCLEDKENNNIKRCVKTIINDVIEYLI